MGHIKNSKNLFRVSISTKKRVKKLSSDVNLRFLDHDELMSITFIQIRKKATILSAHLGLISRFRSIIYQLASDRSEKGNVLS